MSECGCWWNVENMTHTTHAIAQVPVYRFEMYTVSLLSWLSILVEITMEVDACCYFVLYTRKRSVAIFYFTTQRAVWLWAQHS